MRTETETRSKKRHLLLSGIYLVYMDTEWIRSSADLRLRLRSSICHNWPNIFNTTLNGFKPNLVHDGHWKREFTFSYGFI